MLLKTTSYMELITTISKLPQVSTYITTNPYNPYNNYCYKITQELNELLCEGNSSITHNNHSMQDSLTRLECPHLGRLVFRVNLSLQVTPNHSNTIVTVLLTNKDNVTKPPYKENSLKTKI